MDGEGSSFDSAGGARTVGSLWHDIAGCQLGDELLEWASAERPPGPDAPSAATWCRGKHPRPRHDYTAGGWSMRTRLPDGSRTAKSRVPHGCSIGSCTTSAPEARTFSKVASRSSVLKWTPFMAPLATRAVIASPSAGLPCR